MGVNGNTVDGRNPANQLISSLYLQGFIDPSWCRISSINSIADVFQNAQVFSIPSRCLVESDSMNMTFSKDPHRPGKTNP